MAIEADIPENSLDGFSRLSHYQLRQCLGEGGFGQVFEAWDSKLQRPVAIKRLKHAAVPDPSGELLREARIAASLTHPAFVKIHALEDDDDSQAIVMELVKGQTLKQLLGTSPPDRNTAFDIIHQIAGAMQEAHAGGMIHGDLKPSNLMVEPGGQVRILDLGLARRIDVQTTTSILEQDPQGTIAYMAPERLLGAPLSPQTDIYALGVILYELCGGQRPFPELSGLTLAAALMQSSSAQWAFPADADPSLVKLIRTMTAKAPELRLSNMTQVVEQISMIDPSASVIAPPADAQPPTRAPNSQRRLKKSLLTLVIAPLILLSGGGWYLWTHSAAIPQNLMPFSVAREMRTGMEALRESDRLGSLDRAMASFNKILEREPNNAAAVAGLSLAYFYRYGNEDRDEIWLQKADASAQRANQLNDQLAISHAARSLVLYAKGKSDMALLESERALALDASNTFAYTAKLDALIALRRFSEAREVAELAIRNFPQDALYINSLGEILYQQGDYLGAEQAYRQSIKLQPDVVRAYGNLYAALHWQGKDDEGMRVLQEGLQIRSSPLLYTNLGNALFEHGDYVNAAAAFERAVSPEGGNPSSYLGWANLADALLWIPGRMEEARIAYQRARELLAPILAREPNNVVVVSRMSVYCARLGEKACTRELNQRAIALDPKNAQVYFRAGLASELLGDREVALKEIDTAIKLGYPVKMVESQPDLLGLRRDANYLRQH